MSLLRWLAPDEAWLAKLNTVALKALVSICLWVGTFLVWAAGYVWTAIGHKTGEGAEMMLTIWCGSLAGLSGISAYQYTTSRTTDYGYIERKAAAPAANVAGQTVNVAPLATTQVAGPEGTGS